MNSDDRDRVMKGLNAYLRECKSESRRRSLDKDSREYFEIEAFEVEELIERLEEGGEW
jgi:hypothetical protein